MLRAARATVACLITMIVSAGSTRADLVWEDFFADEQSIADGTVLNTLSGVDVTINREVFSDSDGGTFDLAPYDNPDYFSFESGQQGAHFGYLEMAFDNQNNDPTDYIELTLSFAAAITNLQFSLLDVDSGSWDDGVEVFYNGASNAADTPAFYALGTTNGLDNEVYMNGFEGFGSGADSDETIGNIVFDFGTTQITTLRIRYISTDDANNNPGGQRLGVSDLSFTAVVPEPSSVAMMVVAAAGFCGVRLLKRRRNETADVKQSA